MKSLWPVIDPASPAIARRARHYERKLRLALAVAATRESRRDPTLAALYRTATVEGVDTRLRMKKAVVSYSEPPFRGGLHEILEWSYLDSSTVRELASTLAWSLRESVRRSRLEKRGAR